MDFVKGAEMIEDRDCYLKGETKEDLEDGVYVVCKGDTLWDISDRIYGTHSKWKELYEKNKEEIGKNPDMIFEGMKLVY